MTKLNQIYKCELCGNITEVLHAGAGELVCCEIPMTLQETKTTEEGNEKHLPVIETTPSKNRVKIKVGEVPHPMEDAHYIEWIEIKTESGLIERKFLKSSNLPEVEFETKEKIIEIKEYCNIHGLWKKIL